MDEWYLGFQSCSVLITLFLCYLFHFLHLRSNFTKAKIKFSTYPTCVIQTVTRKAQIPLYTKAQIPLYIPLLLKTTSEEPSSSITLKSLTQDNLITLTLLLAIDFAISLALHSSTLRSASSNPSCSCKNDVVAAINSHK